MLKISSFCSELIQAVYDGKKKKKALKHIPGVFGLPQDTTASSRYGICHHWSYLLDISQCIAFWVVSLMSAEKNPLDPFNYKSTGELQLGPIQLE